ncbi:MAG: oxepin-CoA hydrolase/3-oxo-5,6-dehydrosuberyl-CoA semialdehyde dehydrogenase, partial [Polaribacter sp.]
MKLQNYLAGNWIEGDGDGSPLFNSVTGEIVTHASTKGLDFKQALQYGRDSGEALRKMTFQERGLMLKALALYLMER